MLYTCVADQFASESVCFTADDEGGDATTGLHRVSNAIAGALLFACFAVQRLCLLNVLSCLCWLHLAILLAFGQIVLSCAQSFQPEWSRGLQVTPS